MPSFIKQVKRTDSENRLFIGIVIPLIKADNVTFYF